MGLKDESGEISLISLRLHGQACFSKESDSGFVRELSEHPGGGSFNAEQRRGVAYEEQEAQAPEYDVVLCLSLTKWVHLNWGDEGLERMFRRIYRHLRPGGILVLEPQPWSSYGKRKTLTEAIYKNYYRIQLKPEQFSSYLTSPEVGFSSYELVATPKNTSKGFQRPVYLFRKASSPSH
ncbi:7SK snRNA methylphosphate capping enzyme-like [Echinops telfairi]|uniref:7SK snRNA methylphosphate capping enzyme-like n=1 Tax=Echinops telfairi TaxID=9371 RepID=A0AC55D7I6_ECHTE|nr:7SK snRNA methylphosphate capping enzyme-like [Echinops telfairi]